MPTLCADKVYSCVCFMTQEVKVCLTGVQTKRKLCLLGNAKGHSVPTQFADKMYSCVGFVMFSYSAYQVTLQGVSLSLLRDAREYNVSTKCADKVYSCLCFAMPLYYVYPRTDDKMVISVGWIILS